MLRIIPAPEHGTDVVISSEGFFVQYPLRPKPSTYFADLAPPTLQALLRMGGIENPALVPRSRSIQPPTSRSHRASLCIGSGFVSIRTPFDSVRPTRTAVRRPSSQKDCRLAAAAGPALRDVARGLDLPALRSVERDLALPRPCVRMRRVRALFRSGDDLTRPLTLRSSRARCRVRGAEATRERALAWARPANSYARAAGRTRAWSALPRSALRPPVPIGPRETRCSTCWP